MAEPIQSPIGGGIRAVRNTVSSSIFTGGGVVRQRQDSVAANATVRNSALLGGIASQVSNVSQQTIELNKSLQIISQSLAVGANLDRQREAANAQRQRRLISQGLADANEQSIESKIRDSLMEPVKNIGKKVQFGLGKLVNVFFILAGGWLLEKTVNLLKALSGDNQEKFVQIRNDLIKGLLVIGGTVALVTAGMGGLTIGIGKLALALGSVALGGILIRPLDKLKNAIFGVARNAKGMRPPTGGSIPAPGGRKPNVSSTGPQGSTPVGSKQFQNKGAGTLNKVSVFVTSMFGVKNVLEGKPFQYEIFDQAAGWAGASAGGKLGSKIPGPPWFKALAGAITSIIFFQGGYGGRQTVSDIVGEDKLNELQEELKSGNVMPGMMSPVTDQDLLNEIENQRPQREDFKIGGSGTREYERALEEFEADKGGRIEELKGRIEAQKNQANVDPISKQDPKIDAKNLREQKTSSLSKKLGSLEDPKPSVIPYPNIGGGGDPNGASGNVAAGAVGGGVPVIPASNIDNSYVFLAFKNYQVVPT